jgi:hypothetical protein
MTSVILQLNTPNRMKQQQESQLCMEQFLLCAKNVTIRAKHVTEELTNEFKYTIYRLIKLKKPQNIVIFQYNFFWESLPNKQSYILRRHW